MTTYLRDAQWHAKKIDYFHAHAGTSGYAQAHHHLLELDELVIRAYRSKKNQGDVVVIQAIIKHARSRMDEMKERENGDGLL